MNIFYIQGFGAIAECSLIAVYTYQDDVFAGGIRGGIEFRDDEVGVLAPDADEDEQFKGAKVTSSNIIGWRATLVFRKFMAVVQRPIIHCRI